MASIARRAALNLARPTSSIAVRTFATPPPSAVADTTTPPAPPNLPSGGNGKGKEKAVTPKYSPPAVFPAPNNPYELPKEPVKEEPKQYSEGQRRLVRGLARIMGYNTKASTAIRETGRMMKGIVEAVERDRAYWYDECKLPATYQTFFQLHLLYLLILTPRIRALPASAPSPSHPHPIPEPAVPSPPTHSPEPSTSAAAAPAPAPSPSPSSPLPTVSILSKPNYEAYHSELVNHFFELAESQMRRVLGRGERERVIKKYMGEMAEQWRGAGVGMDYVMGLQHSTNPEDRSRADAELASWIWRNLFGARGLGAPAPGLLDPSMMEEFGAGEVEMPEQLEQVIRFVRCEMSRLDKVSHRDVLDGAIGQWGSVRDA